MIHRWLRSPLTRLAWLLPILTLVILSVVLVPTYFEAVSDIEIEVRSAIDEEVLGLDQIHGSQGLKGVMAAVDARTRSDIDRAALYLLTDSAGRRLAGADMVWPDAVPTRNNDWFSVAESGGETLEGKVFNFDGGERLMVARRSPIKGFRQRLGNRLLLASTMAILGSGMLAAWILGRYRRRLAVIQQGARDILGGNLSQRLHTDGRGDELDELVLEFNQAFTEIEKLMDATRHVSSAIAHDMRRPIAAIRYQLEMLNQSNVPAEVRHDILALLELTDESLNAFSALLRLARLESGSYGPKKEPVDLQALMQEIADTYAPVAAAHGMQFSSELSPAHVTGDWNLLFLAVQNLLDNAINYGAARIDLKLHTNGAFAEIVVRDHGTGVSDTDLPRLFERFYRVDSARTVGGSGIGLSLVRAIVDVHGGNVSATNALPGLAVVLRLPQLASGL